MKKFESLNEKKFENFNQDETLSLDALKQVEGGTVQQWLFSRGTENGHENCKDMYNDSTGQIIWYC